MGAGTWQSHHAITQLLFEYQELYNRGRFSQMGELFKHATYQTRYPWSEEGHGVQRGVEVTRNFEDMVILYQGLPRVQMSMSNISVDIDEEGARASSKALYVGLFGPPATWSEYVGLETADRADDRIEIMCAGHYEDEFERSGSEWRFTSRIAFADFTGDRSRHMSVDPVAYGKVQGLSQ
jgi:hypothetical protein